MAAFEVRDLVVSFGAGARRSEVVHGVSFAVGAGRTLAIVGESGSGKSVALLAATGLLPPGASVQGSVLFQQREILGLSESRLRALRGAGIGYVFQDPSSNLHPLKTVGRQIAEAISVHRRMSRAALRARAIELLDEVGIKEPARRLHDYPHQFSGGMRQRVMIAIAIAMNPAVIIADEPTTALDVTVQASILRLLKRLQQRHGTALVFVSHDLAVVSEIADDIAVMRHGVVVESGPAAQVQETPAHVYTRELLDASRHAPVPASPARQPVPAVAPLLVVDGITRSFPQPGWFAKPPVPVLHDVSFALHEGEILGLVGESGSGKSTIGRIVAALDRPDSGSVTLEAQRYAVPGTGPLKVSPSLRAAVQVIFQDPYGTLNPRQRVRSILSEPFVNNTRLGPGEIAERVTRLMERVALPVELLDRFPAHLSGGQRQRVAIGRAIALQPRVVVADEPVSALDSSTQRKIIELLRSIRATERVSFLFISHDLGVVAELCDRVIVLEGGRVVEAGPAAAVLKNPQHSYTKKLVASIPGRMRSPINLTEFAPEESDV
jgi:peptide/nickel transport system ATP-binding protein